jgi:hypothetical protein
LVFLDHLQLSREIVEFDVGLLEDAAQSSNGQLTMERHHAADTALRGLLAEYDVAAALSGSGKPSCSKARIASSPETPRNLGIGRFKSRQQRSTPLRQREFLQIEFGGLLQVEEG